MRKPFYTLVSVAVLGVVSWGILEQLRAQDQLPPIASEETQRRVLRVFGEKQEELFKNPDVLGVVPQPGNGTIKIITDRPANVPKEVEGVPVETAPPPPLLPPPPGVILLRPGGVIERREDLKECPKGFWEYPKYRWRFCQPEGDPQVVPNHLMNPPIAGIPFEEAEKIYHRHSEELMQIPGTISVGLGAEGIVVRTDHPELVPSEVEGLPVKTEPVRGMPRRMSHTVTQETNPFHGGTSVAASTTPLAWGTSSGVVLSEGKPWIVSVSHILAQCDGFPICAPYSSPLNACPHYSGETIVQSPEQNPTTVGRASRWTRLVPDPSAPNVLNEDVVAAFADNDGVEGNASLPVNRTLEGFTGFKGLEGTLATGEDIYMVTARSCPDGSPVCSGAGLVPHVIGGRITFLSTSVRSFADCIGTSGGTATSRDVFEFENNTYRYLPGTSGSIVLNSVGEVLGIFHTALNTSAPYKAWATKRLIVKNALGFDSWYGALTAPDNTYAVFRGSEGRWYVDNGDGRWTGTSGDITFQFGSNGDFPVTGNWNGGSVKCLGVYRPSAGQFFIDYNCNGTWDGTPTDKLITMGIAEDRPLAGDWDGNGIDQVGLFRGSVGTFFLENGNFTWNGCGGGETCFSPYGIAGDLPVGGNWPGSIQNGRDKVGLYRRSNSMWYLEAHANNAWNGCGGGELCKGPFGLNTDWPVAGNWTGVGNTDKIGVYHHNGQGIVPNHTWVLDNGDYIFTDFQREQKLGPYGTSGDLPATWRKSVRKAN